MERRRRRVSATIDCDLNYLRALYAVIGGRAGG